MQERARCQPRLRVVWGTECGGGMPGTVSGGSGAGMEQSRRHHDGSCSLGQGIHRNNWQTVGQVSRVVAGEAPIRELPPVKVNGHDTVAAILTRFAEE